MGDGHIGGSRDPLCRCATERRDRDRRRAALRRAGSERPSTRRRARRCAVATFALTCRSRSRGEARRCAQARLRPRTRTLQVNRQEAERRGRGAETLACWYLRLKGWRILARRARVRGGEVDIVARRGRTLAFVEVKARATEEAAAFALDEWRLRRVIVAAERLAPRYMRDGDDVRIDALFIVPGRWPNHLANVWLG